MSNRLNLRNSVASAAAACTEGERTLARQPGVAGERTASAWVHIVLYAVLPGLPISRYLLSFAEGGAVSAYGLSLPSIHVQVGAARVAATVIHDWLLPALFYLAIGLPRGRSRQASVLRCTPRARPADAPMIHAGGRAECPLRLRTLLR